MPKTWIKYPKPRGFDSAARCQRNLFAFRVMMVLTDGQFRCLACRRPMVQGNVEVDRTIGGQHDERGEIYTEGQVVYVCQPCNSGRGILQSVGRDWPHVERYVAMVAQASAQVTMPTTAEAKRWQASGPWPLPDEPEEYVNQFA